MTYESFSKFQLTVLHVYDPLIIRSPNREPLCFGSTMLTITMTSNQADFIYKKNQ